MKIGQYEITWGEKTESVFSFLQISGPDKVRALFAIWMHDSIEMRKDGKLRISDCVSVVNLYVDIFFIEFKILKIYP